MQSTIDYSPPTNAFWADYLQLWQQSINKPVFEAPALLQYFSTVANGRIAIFKCYRGTELVGAGFFHQENKEYTFLSDLKTDHNCFVIHSDCSKEEIHTFFEQFHEAVKKENWSLVLNNQPMWISYMKSLTESGQNSNLFWLSAPSSVCPRLEEKTPDALLKSLLKSRNNRYKRNRFIREQNVEFEVLEADEDLKTWTENFADTHVIRWADTMTPSKYRFGAERTFLLDCMHAWNADKRLVRFALKVGDTRVAFVIGLLQQNSLIYHSLTYHPEYHKYSPGKVLLLYLGEWMHTRQLNILDFGDGNEPYKYDFANTEQKLHSIFISQKQNLFFMLKAMAKVTVRKNPAAIQFYREKLRPMLQMLRSKIPKFRLSNGLFLSLHTLFFDYLPVI